MTYAGYIEMDAFCTDLLHDCLYGTDYIAHANRNGKERKNHKYSFRKWAGDHWEYFYDKITKSSERRRHQENLERYTEQYNNAKDYNERYKDETRYGEIYTKDGNVVSPNTEGATSVNKSEYQSELSKKMKAEQDSIDKIDKMPVNVIRRMGEATIEFGKILLDGFISISKASYKYIAKPVAKGLWKAGKAAAKVTPKVAGAVAKMGGGALKAAGAGAVAALGYQRKHGKQPSENDVENIVRGSTRRRVKNNISKGDGG